MLTRYWLRDRGVMNLLDFAFRVPGAYVFLLWCCLLRLSLPFLPTIFPFSCLSVTDYGLLCDSLHQAMETGNILQRQGHEAARYTGSTRRGKRLKRYLEDSSVPVPARTLRYQAKKARAQSSPPYSREEELPCEAQLVIGQQSSLHQGKHTEFGSFKRTLG